jgi:glycosyltransferase 2 family protein
MPGLVISLVCLGIVLWLSKPRQVLLALSQGDLKFILLGVLVSVAWVTVRSLAWRTLLRGQPNFSQAFFTTSEGYLLNNILPFRLGEVARSLLMAQKIGSTFWEVIPTVVIERLLDLILAAGVLMISVSFVVGAEWAEAISSGAGLILLIAILAFYLVALRREGVLAFLIRITRRWPRLQRFSENQIGAFFQGLSVITEARTFILVLFYMLLDWSIGILQFYVALKAFFPEATLLQAAFVLGVTAMGIAAPSSPGGLGVFELAMVAALAVFKYDPAVALACALTVHFTNYLVTGVLGAIGLAKDGETMHGLYLKARQFTLSGNQNSRN